MADDLSGLPPAQELTDQELRHLIDRLVASSVHTHRILETPPDAAISLAQRATAIMAELKALRAAHHGKAHS